MWQRFSGLFPTGFRGTGCLSLLFLLAFFPHGMKAQPASTFSPLVSLSVVTIAPGPSIHARFGHTALRVWDPVTGYDVMYNYGTFNFDPLFVFRFAYGQLDYMLTEVDFSRAVLFYEHGEQRTVVTQLLRLPPEDVLAIAQFLDTNARPENRTYRYDFLFDNCATRPRDVLQAQLGERLRTAWPEPPPGTFRDLLAPYLVGTPMLKTGLDLILGMPVDREATHPETAFLPEHYFAHLAASEVEIDGEWLPLVAQTDTLVWLGPGPSREGASWWTVSLYLLLLLSLLDLWKGRTLWPRVSKGIDIFWFSLVSVAGLVLVFLGYLSLHHVTAPNLNLLWAFPGHFILVWGAISGRKPKGLRIYSGIAAVAVLVAVGLGMEGVGQALTAPIVALALITFVRLLPYTHAPRG